MGRSPKVIAQWRHGVIEEALDPTLTRKGRSALLVTVSKSPVRWPGGPLRRVSRSTLYRWMALFAQGGLEALDPRPRRDRGRKRRRLPPATVREALALLEEDPTQSLTFLCHTLAARQQLRGIREQIPRSTLQRRLAATKVYERIRRQRERTRARTRFVAACPHRIWQLDALGPVEVRLVTRQALVFHVISIIDDATRAILAAQVIESPTLGAAVGLFREAARRWGLCDAIYADRASIFDALAFRGGLATLGVRRIPSQAGNAPARGKIEAYHRVLRLWFIRRLGAQRVVDRRHLQLLLDGVIHSLYQRHTHRGIRRPPGEALAGRRSQRSVSEARLVEVFFDERRRKVHRVTGEVDLGAATWLAPRELRGQRATVLVDPAGEASPQVVHPVSGKRLPMRKAAVKPEDLSAEAEAEPWADGPLQTIYDAWRGRPRPLAEAGFGLSEVYLLLAGIAKRHVPASDVEAALVQRFWQAHGPLARRPAEREVARIGRTLGPGRPIQTYLDVLAGRISGGSPAHRGKTRRKHS